jgi:hypothetical protein
MRDVKVVSIPEGAGLYAGGSYAGRATAGGVTFRREEGTRLRVRCDLAGYQNEIISVAFDGSQEIFVCQLRRRKKCVDGLKSPWDDCPEPGAPDL